jgi:hypothetical protein
MTAPIFVGRHWRYLLLVTLSASITTATGSRLQAQGPLGPNGVDILVRAENRSTADRPFCGSGGGKIGDTLTVDAFMNSTGVMTGTARFEDADGNVTLIELDRMFGFGNAVGGGVLIQNQGNQNTAAIWLNDFFANPVLVNVELPRGCGNTVSTFTPGVDKVTVQLKFK